MRRLMITVFKLITFHLRVSWRGKGFMQKKVPQFLIVLEIEESTCCMYWLYHKADILMIYYLLYCKNLLVYHLLCI